MNDTAQIQVSVCIITYKQREFIKDCIEGALMQQTNFNFEIVIGDDNSTDGTSEICKCYANRNKNIHYHLRKRNLGMMGNWIATIQNCSGKYIALCEGDDYWTDPLKLQKQVDFMEANKDYSICFHDVLELRADGKLYPSETIESRYENIIDKNNIDYKDLLVQGNFIHTCSVVFRNEFQRYPVIFQLSSVADYLLHIHNSRNGKIKKLNERMAVYRVGIGIYSSLSAMAMNKKILQYLVVLFSYLDKLEDKKIVFEKIKVVEDALTAPPVNNQISTIKVLNQASFSQLKNELLKRIRRKFRV